MLWNYTKSLFCKCISDIIILVMCVIFTILLEINNSSISVNAENQITNELLITIIIPTLPPLLLITLP